MELKNYFSPVSLEKPGNHFLADKAIFCRNITIHTPDIGIGNLSEYQIAIIGIPEDRNAKIKGSAAAPDHVRNNLYKLYRVNPVLKIIDLGNLIPGNSIQDTYYALRDIVLELKDKVSAEMGDSPAALKGDQEALEAMRSLGYSAAEARDALRKIPNDIESGSDRLRAALKLLGK